MMKEGGGEERRGEGIMFFVCWFPPVADECCIYFHCATLSFWIHL